VKCWDFGDWGILLKKLTEALRMIKFDYPTNSSVMAKSNYFKILLPVLLLIGCSKVTSDKRMGPK